MITRKLISDTVRPSPKMNNPAPHRLRRNAYQIPRHPTDAAISSFVDAASSANTANRTNRSSSRNQIANKISGMAMLTA